MHKAPLTAEEKVLKKAARSRAEYFLKTSKNPKFANHPENLKRDTHKLLETRTKSGKTLASCLFRGNASSVIVRGVQHVHSSHKG